MRIRRVRLLQPGSSVAFSVAVQHPAGHWVPLIPALRQQGAKPTLSSTKRLTM